MSKMLQVALVVSCIFSFAVAATVSIGTISARGDMRVNHYMVNGNATLFDGSVVETGQASAVLRLDKGAEVTLAAGSRATLYRDRLVLQQGESEFAASTSFQIEANGLHVTPGETNSRGVVSTKSGNTVEVADLTGSLAVTNEQGILLASVGPGPSMSFAIQADGGPSACTGTGRISLEGNNYFITITSTGIKYELTGADLARLLGNLVGKSVTIKGTIVSGTTPTGGTTGLVNLQNFSTPALSMSTGEILLVSGRLIVSGAVGRGTGVRATNQPRIPAGAP
jgi:hypothetical protein